jgi:hypothetical protein
MSRVNAAGTVAPTIRNSANVNTTNVLQGKNYCTFQSLRTSLRESSAKVRETGDPLHYVKDLSKVSTSSGVLSKGMVTFNHHLDAFLIANQCSQVTKLTASLVVTGM